MHHSTTAPQFNIAYGADVNFLFGVGISILSIVSNNKPELFHIHIFTDAPEKTDELEYIKKLAKDHFLNISIHFIANDIFKHFPTNHVWNHAIYFRLIIATYFHKKTDKFLYLDADAFCISDMTDLIYTDLKNNVVAAIADNGYNDIAGFNTLFNSTDIEKNYFNSGVMLIDVKRWHEENITEKTLSILGDKNINHHLVYFDQDAINIAVNGDVLLLPEKFNFTVNINDSYKNKIRTPNKDTVLVHFIGPTKPWHSWGMYCKQTDVFLCLKEKAPYNSHPLHTPKNKIQYKYAAKHAKYNKKYFNYVHLWLKYTFLKLTER